MYRHPKTTNERRQCTRRNWLWFDDYRIRLRPSRNQINLPDTYDDVLRNDWGHRSWKRHRKTQYRV